MYFERILQAIVIIIDALKKALMEAEKNASAVDETDEYLEQRIRFLKHQVREEQVTN